MLDLAGLHYDYYWRDYTGVIPNDAVEGGRDVNNKKTYIGQVYVHKFGVTPVTIYEGSISVTPSGKGYCTYDNYVKILCSGTKSKFKWVRTNAKDLHVQMIGKHLVRGGVDHDKKVANIGRILHKGEVIVAKVCGGHVGNALLYYSDDGYEKSTDTYEVLIYEN